MQGIQYPADLPVSQRREEILQTIHSHQVVILSGETGSGKTTQLPKMCLELGLGEKGMIGCTQPRRVAAYSVSKRVAEELGLQWGAQVGCKMRFQDDTSPETVLKFMTDGILLAEIQTDPLLKKYSVILLDEAHERSLNIDFLIGYLRLLTQMRKDLKILITSATMDTEAFSAAFANAPVITVSGRTYPVEIVYRPLETFPTQESELNEVEASVIAASSLVQETRQGDILVFMPTERDIREARDLLEGRLKRDVEVIPLYGRLSSADQQRVFQPGPKRRIIVSTNVAETSLTLPRIRYVIDTGLARISRYQPRTRTKRLPIEPISKSSANQRAGRAGRIQDGMCIRLYSEEDFEKRAEFTVPEIQRANLAEVILRMHAFQLGEIENFPFINSPLPAATRSGYELLQELGALDGQKKLTPLGKQLASLPVDPTLGRMLLRAKEEKVLPEMLVIAAGLSIPDPRERPEDAKEKATLAQRAFLAPTSDFMSLLRIWMAAPDVDSGASRNALRKFCRDHYLSLSRMREWRDLYRQLAELMGCRARKLSDISLGEDFEAAIHRSILSGLLGHVGKKLSPNVYLGSGKRQLMIFPGSQLFQKRVKKKPEGEGTSQNGKSHEKNKPTPEWIVCGEIVQTSQLFARTVAQIDPASILQVGLHLCRFTYGEPTWNAKTGRIQCLERTLIHGLEIRQKVVDYGKIRPEEATALFVERVLLNREQQWPEHPFKDANLRLCDKLRAALIRSKNIASHEMEESLRQFYLKNLKGVSSVHDLNRLIKKHRQSQPRWLFVTEEDLVTEESGQEIEQHLQFFPDQVSIGNSVLPVSYLHSPGSEKDGTTIRVPLPLAPHLTSGQLNWLVPGMRGPIIEELLRALPRRHRKLLHPISEKVSEILEEFDPGRQEFLPALAGFVSRKYRLEISSEDWSESALPAHLIPRLEVVDESQNLLHSGRGLREIQQKIFATPLKKSDAWEGVRKQFERDGFRHWSFGDVPERILVETIGGAQVYAYPSLEIHDDTVSLKLKKSVLEAVAVTNRAIRWLAEKNCEKDLAWVRKELSSFSLGSYASIAGSSVKKSAAVKKASSFGDLLSNLSPKMMLAHPQSGLSGALEWVSPFANQKELHESVLKFVAQALFRLKPLHPLQEKRFQEMVASAKKTMPALIWKVKSILKELALLEKEVHALPRPHPNWKQDLERLLFPGFPEGLTMEELELWPKFLKAMIIRAQRHELAPSKDAQKAEPLEDLWSELSPYEKTMPEDRRRTFQLYFEELRVQIFAPELGTHHKVSPKRLRDWVHEGK